MKRKRKSKVYYYNVEDAQGGIHEYDAVANCKRDAEELISEMARNDDYEVLGLYFAFTEPTFNIAPRIS